MLFTQNIQTAKELLAEGHIAAYDHHIHTKYSDGSFTLQEVISMAKNAKLKRIVITDHNNILSCAQEARNISPKILGNLEVFVGSEIACKVLDKSTNTYIPIELLYYGPNPEKVQNFIDQHDYKMVPQEKQLQFLIQQCDKKHLKHSKNLAVPKGMFATEYLCKDLLLYQENKTFFDATHPIVYQSPKLFFKKFCIHPSSDFYIDTTQNLPTAKEVADMAISSGGITIVAHPCLYIYENQIEVLQFLDDIFATTKVGGLEPFHSSHTLEQRKYLYEYAKKNRLFMGGGSDFHSGPQTTIGFGKRSCPLSLSGKDFDWIGELYQK